MCEYDGVFGIGVCVCVGGGGVVDFSKWLVCLIAYRNVS